MEKFYILTAVAVLSFSIFSCDDNEKETEKPKYGNSIRTFEIEGLTIAIEGGKISFTVAQGTDISNLTPTITISDGATISPASGVAQDFTNPVTYTVTSEAGVTRTYEVTALIKFGLKEFAVKHGTSYVYSSWVDHSNSVIDVHADFHIMRHLQSVNSTAVISMVLEDGYTASLPNGSELDLNNPGVIAIYNAGKTFTYSIVLKNTSNAIKSVQLEADPLIEYSLSHNSYADHLAGINGNAVIIRTLSDVPLTNVVLQTFTFAERATISPDPTQPYDFSIDRKFTITSETGLANQFTLRVIKDDFLMEWDLPTNNVVILADGSQRGIMCESVSPVVALSLTRLDNNSIIECSFSVQTVTARRFFLVIDPVTSFPKGKNYRLNVTLANGKSLQVRNILEAK